MEKHSKKRHNALYNTPSPLFGLFGRQVQKNDAVRSGQTPIRSSAPVGRQDGFSVRLDFSGRKRHARVGVAIAHHRRAAVQTMRQTADRLPAIRRKQQVNGAVIDGCRISQVLVNDLSSRRAAIRKAHGRGGDARGEQALQ